MTNLYKNIRASLAAFVKLSLTNMVSQGVLTVAPKNFDFDATATIEELPQGDCLGFGGLTATNNENVIEGGAMLIASTYDDIGTLRMIAIIDYLFDLVQPGMFMPLLDHTTGNTIGELTIVSGATITPVERTKTRPLQAISFQFRSSKTPSN